MAVISPRGYDEPEDFIPWTDASGVWLAARIEGTNP